MATPTTPRRIDALDVSLAVVEAQLADPLHQSTDPLDALFVALPTEHPENVPSSPADYSNWTPGGAA
jgi:hypothetical protein